MGEDIGAVPWLRLAIEKYPSVRIMLNTMRSGPELEIARLWLEEKGVPVWALNHNPNQDRWTTSPKAYAYLYIDDCALGTPLRSDGKGVDWDVMGPMLMERLERDLSGT